MNQREEIKTGVTLELLNNTGFCQQMANRATNWNLVENWTTIVLCFFSPTNAKLPTVVQRLFESPFEHQPHLQPLFFSFRETLGFLQTLLCSHIIVIAIKLCWNCIITLFHHMKANILVNGCQAVIPIMKPSAFSLQVQRLTGDKFWRAKLTAASPEGNMRQHVKISTSARFFYYYQLISLKAIGWMPVQIIGLFA